MYKQVETDAGFKLSPDSDSTPVATLADEYGGRCQIATDDRCYVLYLKQEDGYYKRTAWIFDEAFEVLRTLSPPGQAHMTLAEGSKDSG